MLLAEYQQAKVMNRQSNSSACLFAMVTDMFEKFVAIEDHFQSYDQLNEMMEETDHQRS